MGLEAASGKVAFRFDSLVFQSITLADSTRLPASPAERLMGDAYDSVMPGSELLQNLPLYVVIKPHPNDRP